MLKESVMDGRSREKVLPMNSFVFCEHKGQGTGGGKLNTSQDRAKPGKERQSDEEVLVELIHKANTPKTK